MLGIASKSVDTQKAKRKVLSEDTEEIEGRLIYIGAVAIIRFRTLINDPRNIIFMFSGISIGIATGVYGYSIAISGTIIFCIIAFLLHYSPFGKATDDDFELVIDYSDNAFTGDFDRLLILHCKSYSLEIQRKTEVGLRRRYVVNLKSGSTSIDLFEEFKLVQGILTVRVEKNEVRMKL